MMEDQLISENSNSRARFSGALIWLPAMALIAGCAPKPPACTDPPTVDTVQRVTMDAIKDQTSGPLNLLADDQPVKQFGVQYRQGLKIELANAVQNGYDSNARKYSCEGKLSVSTPRGQVLSVVTSYDSQALAEGNGKFLVHVTEAAKMAEAVGQDFVEYVSAKTGGGRTVAEMGTNGPSNREACVQERIAAVDRKVQAQDDARAKEAEKTNGFFHATPLGEVEELKDAARKEAEAACR